jgi:nucleoside-diphosphate-sugar epimerase
MNIIITGISGFVGSALEKKLSKDSFLNLNLRNDDWKMENFNNAQSFIHLAGKAHDIKNPNSDDYYKINLNLTKQLVDKAIKDGIQQFIYISTTKVYGDDVNTIIDENTPCLPNDDYGNSKYLAEQYLLSKKNEIRIAIIRPPLIYGPGVKGNVQKLIQLSQKKFPIPLGNINNKRSILYVENLIDFIICIYNQKAEGIFLITDGNPVSTSELIKNINLAVGNKMPLFPIPTFLQLIIKKIKPHLYKRLFGNYEINDVFSRKKLNFKQNHIFADAIKKII